MPLCIISFNSELHSDILLSSDDIKDLSKDASKLRQVPLTDRCNIPTSEKGNNRLLFGKFFSFSIFMVYICAEASDYSLGVWLLKGTKKDVDEAKFIAH